MKLFNKIQKFMYGRYGIDELYKFLFGIYILILILNLFIDSSYLVILELIIIFIMFYRSFSKKIYKRSNENQKYLKYKKRFLKPFKNLKRNISDNDHVYKKCSKCKTTLKLPLPNKRGINHTKCPKCKKKITLFTFKKQKIEIIKNNERVSI